MRVGAPFDWHHHNVSVFASAVADIQLFSSASASVPTTSGTGASRHCVLPSAGFDPTPGLFVCLPEQRCSPGQFACRSGKMQCIPMSWQCDGWTACDDKSDEMDCPREYRRPEEPFLGPRRYLTTAGSV